MLPTSTMPMTPLLFPASVGMLFAVVAVGALVALVVGMALHHREPESDPVIDVADGAAAEKPARPRVSA